MMKENLDLSADDDNVHSWLDALNEKELSRLRKNFLRNVAASFKWVGGRLCIVGPDRRRIIGTPTPGRVSEPCNRRPFRAVRGALESAAGGPIASWPPSNFWANSPFVLPKNEILAESEFAAPTITNLIPIPFSTSGASVAYNVNSVADQFQRAFQTSTFCNRLYSFFNKRWFFDQVLNDFLVRSFLRFGYEVSFEALDKGAIEILGPYGISYTFRRLAERISQLQSGFVVRRVRYDPWPPAWWGRLLRCG